MKEPENFSRSAIRRVFWTTPVGLRHFFRDRVLPVAVTRRIQRLASKDGSLQRAERRKPEPQTKGRTQKGTSRWIDEARAAQRKIFAPAQPFVQLADVFVAQGDFTRAEAILRDGQKQHPDNLILAEKLCQLALQARRPTAASAQWQKLADTNYVIAHDLREKMAQAFVELGDLEAAQGQVLTLRTEGAAESRILPLQAKMEERAGNWHSASEYWRLQAELVDAEKPRQRARDRMISALLQAGLVEEAAEHAERWLETRNEESSYRRLAAKVASHRGDWAATIDHWAHYCRSDASGWALLPKAWITQFGIDPAIAQTQRLPDAFHQSVAALSLAEVLRSVDQTRALSLARLARATLPEAVYLLTADVLATDSRHAAAAWWLRRAIAHVADPRPFYKRLVSSLIANSRYDECAGLLDQYEDVHGRDTLWLTGVLEIAYRCGNFAEMKAIMDAAISKRYPRADKSVRVTGWLSQLINLHPDPASFLPKEIQAQVVQIARLYDTPHQAVYLQTLLEPGLDREVTARHSSRIDDYEASGGEVDPSIQEDMLNQFVRSREWALAGRAAALPTLGRINPERPQVFWNVARIRADLRLAEGDVTGAEEILVDFVDHLRDNNLDRYLIERASGILSRLPTSAPLVEKLRAGAEHVDFAKLEAQLAVWDSRFCREEPSRLIPKATRSRCIIVGNAPSIAELPLGRLAGEDIFCVNRGVRAVDIGLPRPKYLVVADPLVYKNHTREIDADGARTDGFFVGANCLWRHIPENRVVPYGTSGLKLSLAPFHAAPLHLHRGESVVVIAASLAHLMGYREICIIGVDLDYAGPQTHFYTSAGSQSREVERLANFRAGGSGTELVNLAFENLQKVIAADGARMVNAARGGSLNSLPRVKLEDFLSDARPDLESMSAVR